MQNTFQQNYNVLSSAIIGLEIECYSELSPKDTAKGLSLAMGKKVIVPIVIKELGKEEKGKYHSEFEPTSSVFKLERDFSGGKEMYEMITGPMPYEEARIVLIKALEWIKMNGWTDEKSAIHLNVSFNEFKIKIREPLMNLNVLKFVLGFNEEFIYSRFPERRDSVYAKSICNVYPLNRFVFFDKPESIDKTQYYVPHEKYYGINFSKLPHNYLELRYLGGLGYENKASKILEILDYYIKSLYDTLQNNDSYTVEEKGKLHTILAAQKKAVLAFSDPEKFLLFYPNVQVTVDMKGNFQIIKAYWTRLREILFTLIVDSGLRKGHFNFDTDVSAFQLRDGKMRKANHVLDMELFDCDLSGTFTRCHFYRCKIKSSRINDSKLIESNYVKNSKVEHTSVQAENYLEDCYISNTDQVIDGIIQGGVIRKGIIGSDAQISKETLIVDATGEGKGNDEKKGFSSNQDMFNLNKNGFIDSK